jgi:hypothetical protein
VSPHDEAVHARNGQFEQISFLLQLPMPVFANCTQEDLQRVIDVDKPRVASTTSGAERKRKTVTDTVTMTCALSNIDIRRLRNETDDVRAIVPNRTLALC